MDALRIIVSHYAPQNDLVPAGTGNVAVIRIGSWEMTGKKSV